MDNIYNMDAYTICSNQFDTGIARGKDIHKIEKFIERFCGNYYELDIGYLVAINPTPYIFKQLYDSYSYKELCDELLKDACARADYHYKDRKYNRIKAYNKIANWFLECKYNPKYKKCRDRLDAEYNDLALCD